MQNMYIAWLSRCKDSLETVTLTGMSNPPKHWTPGAFVEDTCAGDIYIYIYCVSGAALDILKHLGIADDGLHQRPARGNALSLCADATVLGDVWNCSEISGMSVSVDGMNGLTPCLLKWYRWKSGKLQLSYVHFANSAATGSMNMELLWYWSTLCFLEVSPRQNE